MKITFKIYLFKMTSAKKQHTDKKANDTVITERE